MAVQYTTYYNIPLLDDGAKSWGAVWNGLMYDLDIYLNGLEAKTPIILTHENEILVHEGDVLKISET